MPPSRSRKRTSAPPATTARTRKCRRPAAAALNDVAGAVLPPFSPPLWASLPEDLVCEIAWRVLSGDFLDYVRFRAVCTSWRSGTVCPRGRVVADPRFHPRRWMMLPEGHGVYPGHRKLRGYVRFFNLDTGTFVRVKLPLFSSHCALDSVDGLLLLQRDEDTGIRLVHPFTGDIAELPPLATLLPQVQNDPSVPRGRPSDPYWWWSFVRYCVCATVSCSAGAITVMLVFHYLRRVAFATSQQDRQWTMPSWEIPVNIAPLSLQGKLYLVPFPWDNGSLVFHMEVGSPPLPPKMIATCPADKLYCGYYLVECDSQILLVGCTDSSMSHVLVYKLEDLILERERSIGMADKVVATYYYPPMEVAAAELGQTAGSKLDDDGRNKRTGTHDVDGELAHLHGGDRVRGAVAGWAIAQLGWVAGPAVMLLFSLVTYFTSSLLADCYRSGDQSTGKRNYTYMDAVNANLSGIKVFFSQIPDFDQISWLSMLAAAMSFTYSSIGLGLGIVQVIANGGMKGSLTGISIGTVTPMQKVWRSLQAFGDIAFAYSYHSSSSRSRTPSGRHRRRSPQS
ncbi:hypothetical protein ZWY2020_027757 [Hordeum vulgare]|nr:hypothetical protein ZWY2020_027757 [Hordeum vulgare]